jgi:hypothetical protein
MANSIGFIYVLDEDYHIVIQGKTGHYAEPLPVCGEDFMSKSGG